MLTLMHPSDRSDFRVSDAERGDAISALGAHFSEGRLTMVEYEERAEKAASAKTRSELDLLFGDLPALSPDTTTVAYYSANEVERAHRSGARPRLGIMALTSIGSLMAIGATSHYSDTLALLFFLLIPAVYTLLYVLKVGPESWHAPSQRQLERQRLRELKMQQRINRHQQRAELTDSAYGLAMRALRKNQRR